MYANYKPFVDRVINKYEGGYGWNAKDPGGPTKYGISCYDLAELRGQKVTSKATWAPLVQEMPLTDAEIIYRTKYANYIRFDDLPPGPDVCMLDYAINSGASRAIAVARAICRVPGSVFMDQLLLDAIKRTDPNVFVTTMCAERIRFMRGIRGGSAFLEFGRGWTARVEDLQIYAEHLIANIPNAAPPAPDLSRVVMPKAKHVATTAGTVTAGSTLGGAVAAHEAGAPAWAVASIAAGVIVAGVAFEAWQSFRAAKLNATVSLRPSLHERY